MARVMARNRRARTVGGRQATHGIRTAYWQSTRAPTGSVLLPFAQRFREAASTRRIYQADLHMPVSSPRRCKALTSATPLRIFSTATQPGRGQGCAPFR
jgi:hypothetical protein